jgi:hypothetical protein
VSLNFAAERFALAAAGEKMILNQKTAEAWKILLNRADSRRPLHAVLAGVFPRVYSIARFHWILVVAKLWRVLLGR